MKWANNNSNEVSDVSPKPEDGHTVPGEVHPVNESKLLLKIDLHLLPILWVIAIMAFIDRVNLGNAFLFRLPQDLGLKGNQQNIALCVFFISYMICDIPANIIMKKVRPRIFLSSCMFLFGLIVTIQGFVQNFGGLVTTRFLLGIFEAGITPGCYYLLSMWYKRHETQARFTFWFNAVCIAGAFGGLLATGIGHLDGKRGYHAWRWIFIIEGVATCVISGLAFIFVSDFPEDSKWLTKNEREFVIQRMIEDQGTSKIEEKITLRGIIKTLTDVRPILAGLMYLGPTLSGYALSYFIPTIVATYNYLPIKAQLYSVPPWAAAFGFSMVIAYLSTVTRMRYPWILFCHLIALSGVFTLFTLHHNNHALYGALCLYLMGVVGATPMTVCWFLMNLEGHNNRAIGGAFQICLGNAAGLIAAFSFQAKDKPTYRLGYSLGIGFLFVSLTASTIYFLLCLVHNKRRASGDKIMIL